MEDSKRRTKGPKNKNTGTSNKQLGSTQEDQNNKLDPSKRVTIPLVQTNSENLGQWDKVYDVLLEFAEREGDPGDSIIFPSWLSASQRKNVHSMAQRLGLAHSSIGEDQDRCILIYRKTKSKQEAYKKNEEEVEALVEGAEAVAKVKSKFDKIPFGMTEILPKFLYLGSVRDAASRSELESRHVKHVLNCAKEADNYHLEERVIEYHNANLKDIEEQDLAALEACLKFITKAKEQGTAILVHCIVGKSRSSTVVIAYLMQELKMTLKQAYDHVKERRPIIQPNEGFMRQLLELEYLLYKQNTMQKGDWVPLILKLPKKPKPTNQELLDLVTSIVGEYVTDRFLQSIVDTVCDGSFEKRKLGAFLTTVPKVLGENQELNKLLESKGLKVKDISKKAGERARTYFASNMTQALTPPEGNDE